MLSGSGGTTPKIERCKLHKWEFAFGRTYCTVCRFVIGEKGKDNEEE